MGSSSHSNGIFYDWFCPDYNNVIDASSLENLDTSEFRGLSYMFCGCHKIQDFSFWKIGIFLAVEIFMECLHTVLSKFRIFEKFEYK